MNSHSTAVRLAQRLGLTGPIFLLLVVQLLGGVLMSPQFSFFPVYLAEGLGYSAAMVGTLMAAMRLVGIVSSLASGSLCDVLGRKWTFVLGDCGYLFAGLVYMIRAPWLVVVLWLVAGAGIGLRAPAASSYLIGLADPQRLGWLSGLFTLAITAGAALSSPAAGAILDRWGFDQFGVALVAATLVTLALAICLPNLREQRDPTQRTFLGSFSGYGDLLRRPTVRVLGLLRFLPTCYYGAVTVLIPLLISRLAGNKTAVALYATVSQVMAALTQLASGWAADRYGRRVPTLFSFGMLVAGSLGLAVYPQHLWAYFVFGTLGTSAAWSLSALIPCLVSDATPPAEHSRVLGLLMLVWNAAMIVGSLLGGGLVTIAVGLPFLVVGVLNAVAVFLTLLFFRLQRAA